MGKRDSGIKVISEGPCPKETVEGFNKRIAEVIAMKFSKEFIEKVINEYEKKNQKTC